MTTQALKDGVPDAALCLDYVVNYYPSGTKQKTGSELDQIVERARKNAEDDIIAYLRKNAAEDLGNNSEPCIKKFGLK